MRSLYDVLADWLYAAAEYIGRAIDSDEGDDE